MKKREKDYWVTILKFQLNICYKFRGASRKFWNKITFSEKKLEKNMKKIQKQIEKEKQRVQEKKDEAAKRKAERELKGESNFCF